MPRVLSCMKALLNNDVWLRHWTWTRDDSSLCFDDLQLDLTENKRLEIRFGVGGYILKGLFYCGCQCKKGMFLLEKKLRNKDGIYFTQSH